MRARNEDRNLSTSSISLRVNPPSIECRVSPEDLLDVEGAWPDGDKLTTATALQHAMLTNDLDAFKSILGLYDHAKADPSNKWMTLDMILRQDRPEFLDCLKLVIPPHRRSGAAFRFSLSSRQDRLNRRPI